MGDKISLHQRICKLEEQIAIIPSIRELVHRINDKIDVILSQKGVNLQNKQECKPNTQVEGNKENNNAVNLSENQKKVLVLVKEGLSDLDISKKLSLSRMGVYKARKKLIDLGYIK